MSRLPEPGFTKTEHPGRVYPLVVQKLQYLPVALEQHPVIAPRKQDSVGIPTCSQYIGIVFTPDRISRLFQDSRIGCAKGKEIDHFHRAKARAPRNRDAGADRLVIYFSIGRAWIEHEKGKTRTSRAPGTPETIAIGPALIDDGSAIYVSGPGLIAGSGTRGHLLDKKVRLRLALFAQPKE